jgi:hypothetical protein
VAKGMCVTAIGSKASTGTIDALSITVSSPTSGKCPAIAAGGFGGGGFGGRGFGGGSGGSSQGGATNA